MRYLYKLTTLIFVFCLSSFAYGQEADIPSDTGTKIEQSSPGSSTAERAKRDKQAVDIFLDDEKLSVEADIPSVDLVMSYKGMAYESQSFKKSFLPKIVDSSKKAPF